MLLEHPSSERVRMLLLLIANTAAGPWHSALPCTSAPHHSIPRPPKELCPPQPKSLKGILVLCGILIPFFFLVLVLGEI